MTSSSRCWDLGEMQVRSNFDAGNLGGAEFLGAKPGAQRPRLRVWPAADCQDTEFETHSRTWFYFGVRGLPAGAKIEVEITRMNTQNSLYAHGMKPVFRTEGSGWARVPGTLHTEDGGPDNFTIRFSHVFFHGPHVETFFAFCYPYSFAAWEARRRVLETRFTRPGSEVYLHREVLALSLEKRPIDILTVTSAAAAPQPPESDFMQSLASEHGCYLFPGRTRASSCREFPGKPIVFVSARVHPGETPASFCLDGFLDFLLDEDDPRATVLRRLFVFKFVPVLNPDGVARGHYRADTLGQNLNRFYHAPKPSQQPAVAAVVALTSFYARSGRFSMYLDMHAHASKRGCFIYGNHFSDEEAQVENMVYSRLVALNTPFLDTKACSFSQRNMSMRDSRNPSVSKEGSGRVGVFRATGALRCYTLECNYNCGRVLNEVHAAARARDGGDARLESASGLTSSPSARPPSPEQVISEPASMVKYGPAEWRDVGKACGVALLDLSGGNPQSRVGRASFRSVDNLRALLSARLSRTRHASKSKAGGTKKKKKKKLAQPAQSSFVALPCTGAARSNKGFQRLSQHPRSLIMQQQSRLPILY